MDGLNENRGTVQDGRYGTSVENALIPIDYINVEKIIADNRDKKGNASNAENSGGVLLGKRVSPVVFLRRMICVLLAVVGVLSYGYLGFRGVEYIGREGFISAVSDGVFGGKISEILPILIPSDDPADETITENSANDKNTPVLLEDIGCSNPDTVFNETKYDPDDISVSAMSVIPEMKKDTTVLIIHTHGTESYSDNVDAVAPDEDFRTDSTEENVIAVGKAFAEILETNGIKTIHCTEMFDRESYINAYNRSAEAVKEYMNKYPEITYVLDIHRDAVIRSDGTVVRSNGKGAAQVMIVCGTDEMGADFPLWRENFAFAREYQRNLFEKAPEMVRHMNLRRASFNQQICERYLLLEMGTCGNTLDEAKESARISAEVFADMILEKTEE